MATSSTARYGQVQAYIRTYHTGTIDTTTAGAVKAHFGIGQTTSIGTINVESPIGIIIFHVVTADTPFLFCLQDMDKLGIYFNNLSDTIVKGNITIPVVRTFNHPFMVWGNISINYLTDAELRQLHCQPGYPSVNRLIRTLQRAGHDNPSHHRILEHTTKFCSFCQQHRRSPGRFKFTLKNNIQFNHTLIVNIMYIGNSPVLHVVDETTSFQAARWLQDISASHIWDTL